MSSNAVETKVIFKSKPFVLGICDCGCKEEIPIRTNFKRSLQRFKHGHNFRLIEYKREYTSRGYLFRLQPNYHTKRKSRYVRVHRLIWEEYFNCCLLPWIDLHHINENKSDNRIENLEPLLKADHSSLHHKIRTRSQRD